MYVGTYLYLFAFVTINVNILALNGMAWGALNAILELADKLLFDANYQTPFFNDYDWLVNYDVRFQHSLDLKILKYIVCYWCRVRMRENSRKFNRSV